MLHSHQKLAFIEVIPINYHKSLNLKVLTISVGNQPSVLIDSLADILLPKKIKCRLNPAVLILVSKQLIQYSYSQSSYKSQLLCHQHLSRKQDYVQ